MAVIPTGCATPAAAVRLAYARGRLVFAEEPSPALATRALFWLPNRLLDLADLTSVELHAGPMAGWRVVGTRALALGYTGGERALVLGWHGREAGLHATTVAGESILGWRHRADLGLERAPLLGSVVGARMGGERAMARPPLHPDPVRDGALDLEAALLLAILGASVKVRAGEAPDLVAGLVGLDPSGDDLPGPERVSLADVARDPRTLEGIGPAISAALARAVPGAATLTARALHADACDGEVLRLRVRLSEPRARGKAAAKGAPGVDAGRGAAGRDVARDVDLVRSAGEIVPLDEGTRLARPWLRGADGE